MHRIDGAMVLVVVLVFGPVVWAFGWVGMDWRRTRRRKWTYERMYRRYGREREDDARNDGDMGRHSFRGQADEDGEQRQQRPDVRGRHALDEQDEVLSWAWPEEDLDEVVDAATEVLPIGRGRERAADDTVPRLDVRRERTALGDPWEQAQLSGEPWPESPPPEGSGRRAWQGRDSG